MIKQGLLEGFRLSTIGNKEKDGHRVLRNDLVSDLKYEPDDKEITIESSVISEDLFSQYSCRINILKTKYYGQRKSTRDFKGLRKTFF